MLEDEKWKGSMLEWMKIYLILFSDKQYEKIEELYNTMSMHGICRQNEKKKK
jgi:hypothetical protein